MNDTSDLSDDPTLDRAIGALVGLACGDAVGTTVEFQPRGSFDPVTDMVGGGPFRLEAGQWTDDTSMALCLAESLIENDGMDLADQMRRYVRWRDDGHFSSKGHCFDIGFTTDTQLDRFIRTGEPVEPADEVDQDAQANGSLMRLAPVPIRWWTDPEAAAERSGESSTTTHAATVPVDACRLMGAMVAALIGGATWSDVTAPSFWRESELAPAIAEIAAGSWATKQDGEIKGSGHSVRALEAALWAVDGAQEFREAVLRATNLGDDADTTAAIAGQFAGARWGHTGIPEAWRTKLTLHDEMIDMAHKLHSAAR